MKKLLVVIGVAFALNANAATTTTSLSLDCTAAPPNPSSRYLKLYCQNGQLQVLPPLAPTPVPTVVPTATPTAVPTVVPTATPVPPTPVPPTPTFTPTAPAVAGAPIGPQLIVNTATPVVTGSVISVPSGGDLQAAINSAHPGDVIELSANATFTGNYVFPAKGSGTVWIRSATWDTLLPMPGVRVSPANAANMAKIVTPNTNPAIRLDLGAGGYYFTGIEVTGTSTVTSSTVYQLVAVGMDSNGNSATSLAQLPNAIFDRVYVHGTPTGNYRRGILLNGAIQAVVDSYVSDIHEVGADNQGIGSWNGSGPFKLSNNYVEAACENIMFGGADASVPNLVPSDIEILDNLIAKQPKWNPSDPTYDGSTWSVKNLFELKNAQRVMIDGNEFVHWWPSGQSWAFALTARNSSGGNPWTTVRDVMWSNNYVHDAKNGWNIFGYDNNPTTGAIQSLQTVRVAWINNLVVMDSTPWQVLGGTDYLRMEHNTIVSSNPNSGQFLALDQSNGPNTHMVYQNNIVGGLQYGVCASGVGCGALALNTATPGITFVGNVIYGPWPTPGGANIGDYNSFPGNYFPASLNAVGFISGGYHLAPSSPYVGLATDGKNPGIY